VTHADRRGPDLGVLRPPLGVVLQRFGPEPVGTVGEFEDTVVPGFPQSAEEGAERLLRFTDEVLIAELDDLVPRVGQGEIVSVTDVPDPGPGGPDHAPGPVEASPGIDDITGIAHDVDDLRMRIEQIDVVQHERVIGALVGPPDLALMFGVAEVEGLEQSPDVAMPLVERESEAGESGPIPLFDTPHSPEKA
jgi:hypothetical protein